MPNLLVLAARKFADRAKDVPDEAIEANTHRQQLETAVTEFEKAVTPSEKVDALRAFVELVSA